MWFSSEETLRYIQFNEPSLTNFALIPSLTACMQLRPQSSSACRWSEIRLRPGRSCCPARSASPPAGRCHAGRWRSSRRCFKAATAWVFSLRFTIEVRSATVCSGWGREQRGHKKTEKRERKLSVWDWNKHWDKFAYYTNTQFIHFPFLFSKINSLAFSNRWLLKLAITHWRQQTLWFCYVHIWEMRENWRVWKE